MAYKAKGLSMKIIKTQFELTDYLLRNLDESHVSISEKLIICVISGYVNKANDWKCWPSLDLLQSKCCATRPTIVKATKGLKSKGILDWEKGRTNIPNKYFINVKAVGSLVGEEVDYSYK